MRPPSALVACIAAASMGVSACSNPTDTTEKQQQGSADVVESVQQDDEIAAMLPKDIQASGRLVVSINPDVEPIKFFDSDGDIQGLNPDLLRAAGNKLGVDIEFQEGTFDSMVPGLEAERYDIIASIGDYVERQAKIDFIDYLKSGTGILASTSLKREIKSTEDLCGLSIGYVRGTSQSELVKAAAKACDAAGEAPLDDSAYPEAPAGILSLKSGEADTFWGDLPQMRYNADQNPDSYKLVYQEQSSVYGIGINKGDVELREALRAALLSLADDGVYEDLLSEWAQEDYGLPKFPVNSDNSLED